jgi:hypothetical protein
MASSDALQQRRASSRYGFEIRPGNPNAEWGFKSKAGAGKDKMIAIPFSRIICKLVG